MSQSQTLSSLKSGSRARIAGYVKNCKNSYKMKLLALGLTRGTEVFKIITAPLGDPMEIELRGYRLSLRKAEADVVLMEGEVL
ncbi:MAG: ferrous iron transport protein A [Fibromonadaceae bacterium]|jgi:ferrous iron transport protein A|nr:ferrous iron transport protein A [Fibromonadaceae bacterium]